MANVLDRDTYQFPLSKGRKPTASELGLRDRYDYNALSPPKRRRFSYVRGLALDLLSWIAFNYDVVSTNQEEPPVEHDPVEFAIEVIFPFLTNQAYAILKYKRRAEAQGLAGIPNCTAADVQRQLELLFDDGLIFGIEMDFDIDLSGYESFAFGDCSWRVTKRPPPTNFTGNYKISVISGLMFFWLAEGDPGAAGTTKGDKMFARGVSNGFPSIRRRGISKSKAKEESGPDGDEDDEDDEENQKDNDTAGEQAASRKRKRQES